VNICGSLRATGLTIDSISRSIDNKYRGAVGQGFHTTQTNAAEFPGAPSFAPLFHAKGGGLAATRSATTAKYRSTRFPARQCWRCPVPFHVRYSVFVSSSGPYP